MTIFPAQIESSAASALLFYMSAGIAVVSALVVVASRNIVRTAVALLFTLLGVSGLYFLLNAEFLGAVQLVVYAGGTLILIVFGVMLTSKSPFIRFDPKLPEIIIALCVGSVLLTSLVMGIHRFVATAVPAHSVPQGRYPMDQFGAALLGDYLVPFELISVLLLVVMIGAAYLAKARKRDSQ